MELIVDRSVLLSELGLLQGVVEKKNTLPVLAHLLLRVKEAAGDEPGRVEVAATDLEIGLVSEFDGQCLAAGGVTVSAKKLFEIVRSLPDADVHLKSSDGKSLQVICGRSSYNLVGLPESDFPAIPVATGKEQLSIPRATVLKLVSQTSFAITSDESRFAVSGGLLLYSGDRASLVATDGHRLAFATGLLGGGGKPSAGQVLLPRKTLLELRKIADSGEENLTFSRDDKHVFFTSGTRTMISRILEGTFPQYEKVIPQGHPRVFLLARDELMASVKRVSILSSERTHAVRMTFGAERIELKAESPELGEAREHIPYEYDGPELVISFNAHYILDFLGAVGTEKVEIRLKDAETQALFLPSVKEGQNVDDADYRYVIMPMRA